MLFFFIDESGEFGYGPHSPTKYIVVGCIKTFKKKRLKRNMLKAEQYLVKNMGWRAGKELKWYYSFPKHKIYILNRLSTLDFEFHYCYVKKSNVPQVLHNKDDVVYSYMIGKVLNNNLREYIKNMICVDEKNKISSFRLRHYLYIKAYCEKRLTCNIEILPMDSHSVYCLRAVDFLAGAVRFKYDTNDSRYYKIIEQRIKSGKEIEF